MLVASTIEGVIRRHSFYKKSEGGAHTPIVAESKVHQIWKMRASRARKDSTLEFLGH
jgi:hypothetical protein